MKKHLLHIFNPEDPDEAFQIEYQFDGHDYSIVDAEVDMTSNVKLKVTSFIALANGNFSVAIAANGKHLLAVMAVIKNIKSPEPCILFRAENDRVYQVGIDI